MKQLIVTCATGLLLLAPADAQRSDAPKADTAMKAQQGVIMNCPMMAGTSGMQKDMSGLMSEMQAMMKDTKNPAMKARMQKMQDRMGMMMASMKGMGGRMGNGMMGNGMMGNGMMGNGMMGNGMMSGQQPGTASPAAPATPPVSPEDQAAHYK